MATYYSEDQLNKPLPPPLSASPAPMDHDSRQPTLPFRQDTTTSSHYSQRGNTLPPQSQYPARQNTNDTVPSLPSAYAGAAARQNTSTTVHSQPAAYAGSAAPSQYSGRQNTNISVHSQPTAYAGAAGAYYADQPSYTGQQHLGTQQHQPGLDASPHSATSASPFDTPFDDPTGSSQQNLNSRSNSRDNMYGQNGIPLQDRSGKDNISEMDDHVYDAAPQKKKKQGVRFGELGMFGAYGNRIPWVVYLFTTIQIGVFIGELVDNAMKTGTPIEIKPSFNYLIGPSPYVMINFGARFTPCMHNVQGITDATETISWPCPNATSTDNPTCTLSDLCGFGGIPEPAYDSTASMSNKPEPNQWWRFIVPIFMHAGLIHIGFNLLLQLTMGKEIEKSIGSLRFFLVYVSAGIFGFVLGGNYASAGMPSTGASGGLFGIIALNMLDLFYSWSDRVSPIKDLLFIMLDIIISFVLGLLPGVDNFSHIGGLLMGLCLGLSILHSPNALRRRIGEDDAPYSTVNAAYVRDKPPGFVKNPVGFFKGRKPLWWVWWVFRMAALLLVLVVFIVLLNNFYTYHKTCSWCKYLSCLPVNGWCDSGGLTFTTTTTSSKRDVLEAAVDAVTHLPRDFFA